MEQSLFILGRHEESHAGAIVGVQHPVEYNAG